MSAVMEELAYPPKRNYFQTGPQLGEPFMGIGDRKLTSTSSSQAGQGFRVSITTALAAGMTTCAVGMVVIPGDHYSTTNVKKYTGYPTPQNTSERDSWARLFDGLKVGVLPKPDNRPAHDTVTSARVKRLTNLQVVFGLPLNVFAKVLGISRQGLYKWLDASKPITLQSASVERINVIEGLAQEWKEQTPLPISAIFRDPLISGGSLQSLLTAPVIHAEDVRAAFADILSKLHLRPKSASQKMAEAGFKRRQTNAIDPDED